MRLRLAVALASMLVASASPAAAQDDKAQAREAYEEGERLTRERRYGEAAAAFARADALSPNDTALEAALEAALRGDDPALAMNLRERARRAPSASALPAVARVEAAFASRVAAIDAPCLDEQPPCSLTIDDRTPAGRRTWVVPGPHRLVLRPAPGVAGAAPQEQVDQIDLAPGASHEVSLRAEPALPPAPPPPPSPAAPREVDEEGGGLSPWWVVGGAGVTAVLGGLTIVHAVGASSNKSDFDQASAAGAPVDELQVLADDGASLETRTNVFLVATIVAGAATAGLAIFAVDWGGGEATARGLVLPDAAGGGRFVAVGTF